MGSYLACISSAEEDGNITALMKNKSLAFSSKPVAYVANYREDKPNEPWACMSGEPANGMFDGLADRSSGREASLVYYADPFATPFDGAISVVGAGRQEMHCLCELGGVFGVTPAFISWYTSYATRIITAVATSGVQMLFACLVVGLFPILFSCCRKLLRRLRAPAPDVTGEIDDAAGRSSESSAARLAAAERQAALLRKRVSTTFIRIGWFCLSFGLVPLAMNAAGLIPATAFVYLSDGSFYSLIRYHPNNFHWLTGWGIMILPLAVRPTDAKLITRLCRIGLFVFVFCFLLGAFLSQQTGAITDGGNPVFRYGFLVGAFVFLGCAAALAPTVFSIRNKRCTCGSTMPAREKLARLWLLIRIFDLLAALVLIFFSIGWYVIEGWFDEGEGGWPAFWAGDVGPNFLSALLILFVLIALGPANRGRLHRWIGSLGQSDDTQQAAASVAALISGTSVANALTNAEKNFRGIPVAALNKEDIMDNKPDASLFAKTVTAKMGEVACFVTHSWRDPGSRKFDHLQKFAAELAEKDKDAPCLIWLDKACIDQSNVQADLTALPIYLSGCDHLLLMAGGTYSSRLWCVIELFIYLRMGGQQDTILVRMLADGDDVSNMLSQFDAAKADCFLNDDKQRLLAVIETGFGDFKPFNKIVKDVFLSSDAGRRYAMKKQDAASKAKAKAKIAKQDKDKKAPSKTHVVSQPVDLPPHLRLGITIKGLREFCREAGFPVEPPNDGYESQYERPSDAWITQAFGDPDYVDGEYVKGGNYMGYDLNDHIREWLKTNATKFDETPKKKPLQSVCEVLLERGSKEVGPANIFYSHRQGMTLRRTIQCMQLGVATYGKELGIEGEDQAFFWLDYATLRQCQRDFDVYQVQVTVRDIGFTFIELDTDPQAYLTRVFCILELFSTVKGNAKMRFTVNLVRAMRMEEELRKKPVKSDQAKAREESDKKKIDDFISGEVEGGHKGMDKFATAEMIKGAKLVVEASRGMPTIDLSNCNLEGASDGATLKQIIRDFDNLTELNLEGNDKLGPKGIQAVAQAMASDEIVSLNLAQTNLCNGGADMTAVTELCKSIPKCQIRTLGLGNNQLCGVDFTGRGTYTSAVLTKLAEVLAKNGTITKLRLGLNGLGAQGAEIMAGVLKTNVVLTSLDLSFNSLDAKAAEHLAEGLESNSVLTSLDLANNSLSNNGRDMSGVQKLCAAVPKSAIRMLNVAQNGLDDAAIETLRDALGNRVVLDNSEFDA